MDRKHPAEYLFSSQHPLTSYLDITFVGQSDGVLTARLKAPTRFAVDGEGNLHGGLATLVIDTVFGAAVLGSLEKIQPIATTGLTVQHLRGARAGEALTCEARLDGIANDIAHVSGRLFATDDGEVVSAGSGTFMIGTRSKPLGVRL